MARRFLYLVRHGQYDGSHNKDELGNQLSDVGREQARKTGQALRELPIDHIYTSSMRRAEETARLIAESFGSITLTPTETLWETIPNIPRELIKFFLLSFPDLTAERVEQNAARADNAFEEFFAPLNGDHDEDVHEVVVSHGNLIRYFVCRALDVSPEQWVGMTTLNCGITKVIVDEDGTMTLESYNETNHLPLELRTDNYNEII